MGDFSYSRHLRKIIRVARIDRGMSLQDVADAIAEITGEEPLSRQTIHHYEMFKRHPRIDMMAAWARAVGLRLIVEVVGLEDERIAALIRPRTARVAYLLDLLSDEDLETVEAIARRLAQEYPSGQNL